MLVPLQNSPAADAGVGQQLLCEGWVWGLLAAVVPQ
jgi:hypothetical protein